MAVVGLLGVLLWWLLRDGDHPRDGGEGGAGDRMSLSDARGRTVGSGDDDGGEGASSRLAWKSGRASIAGTVTVRGAGPLAGAQVCAWLVDADTPTELQREPRCTTSDASGRYRIGELPAATHNVHASAPQHVPALWRNADDRPAIELAAGQERAGIDLELETGGIEIRGVVKDIAGGVVEGARVTSHSGDWWLGDSGSGGGLARSDERGEFALWVRPGTITVTASAEGYTKASRSGAAPGFRFELVLTPESVLIGKVVRADTKAAVADAKVFVEAAWQNGGGVAYSDAEGRFRIEGLEPGRYEPVAHAADGYGRAAPAVLLGLGETSAEVVIEMHPATTVIGRIAIGTVDGAPCPGGGALLSSTKHKSDMRWADARADGTVEFVGVLPGAYEVSVWCTSHLSQDRYDPLVVEAEPIRDVVWVVQDGLAIRGIVVDDAGEPIAGVDLSAQPTEAAPRAQMTYGWGERSGVDGSFVLGGLVAGGYVVRAEKVGFVEPVPIEVKVAEGSAAELKVVLPRGGTIAGRVIDSRGAAVGGAHVMARGEREDWRSRAMTGDDGTFELDAIEPGEHRVAAMTGWSVLRGPGQSDDDIHGETVTVVAGETAKVELTVEDRSGAIAGRVVDGDGGPVTDAFVQASREPDGAGSGAGNNRLRARWSNWENDRPPELVDQDGVFTLDDLGPGNYTVFATRKGGGEGIAEHVTVGKKNLVVRIADTASISGRVKLAGGEAPERFTITAADTKAGVREEAAFFRTGGKFTVDGLPPGEFEVAVESSDGAADQKVTLSNGEEKTGIVLELVPRVLVTGRVIDLVSGVGVPNMMMSIAPTAAGGWTVNMVESGGKDHITDGDGRFTVKDAPAGKVRVIGFPMTFGNGEYDFMYARAAIPAGVEKFELPDLKIPRRRLGRDQRAGDLGFEVREPDAGTESEDRPLTVAFVRPGGPAAVGGLAVGDVITSLDGHDVTGDNQYRWGTLSQVPPGTPLDVGVEGGKSVTIVAGKPK